ncbi:MAG: PKD domain-containing protein [bacterium]
MLNVVTAAAGTYYGKLRVYVAEPLSRWDYDSGEDIHNGFLDFAIVQNLSIADASRAEYTTSWDASVNGFPSISASNLEIMAAAFNRDSVDSDAYPPYGYYFWAHYADAAAAAKPGLPGQNETIAGFTHTVFVEEGTATWCTYCPYVAEDLHNLAADNSLLFEYVAMVAEVPDTMWDAYNRMKGDYNAPGWPSVFLDGGYRLGVGDIGESFWRTFIEQAGARVVPDIDLVVKVDHTGSDVFDIKVRLGNGVPANGAMATPNAPSGDNQGSSGIPVQLQATHTDAEGDDLIYQFDFGDSETSPWSGPHSSGQACEIEHTYNADGLYQVTVRVMDEWGEESSWSSGFAVDIGGSCCMIRGDVNHDGEPGPDIGDLVWLVNYMFNGGPPPPCMEEANINGEDGENPDIGDLVWLVNYMFNGGPPPAGC